METKNKKNYLNFEYDLKTFKLKNVEDTVLIKLLHENYLVFSNDFIKYLSKDNYPIDVLIFKILNKKISMGKIKYFYNKKCKIKSWYEDERKIKISDTKIFISENNFICRVDGINKKENGILLIKNKYEIDIKLLEFYLKYKSGTNADLYYYNHIPYSDYLEIQYCLKITNTKWCDYVVYSKQNNLCYMERFYINNKICNEIFDKINSLNILLKNYKNGKS
jgi:hypothetical protein